MKRILLSLLLIVLFSTSVAAAPLTLNQIGEASCRVHVAGAYGSGTAVHDDGQFIYVLTNNHVVGNSQNASCEFFRFGRKTNPIVGQVIWRTLNEGTPTDFAIIKLPKSEFGNYPPRIIPLAPASHKIKKDDYIASAGCPEARWLQLWEGFALDDATNQVLFTPAPLGGQSGSGVHTVINGKTYLAAILTWRIGDGGMDDNGFDRAKGGAIPMSIFHSAIKGQVSYWKIPKNWKRISKERLYALGSDGKFYEQIDGEVTFPTGVIILKYNITYEEAQSWGRNGGGGRRPNNPNNPSPNNPFGTLPPNFGIEDDGDTPNEDEDGNGEESLPPIDDECEKKLKELQDKYAELEKKFAEAITQKQAIENSLKEANDQLNKSKETFDNLKKENDSNLVIISNQATELLAKSKLVDELQKQLLEVQSKIEIIVKEKTIIDRQLTETSNNLIKIVEEKSTLEKSTNSLSNQRNVAFGLGGLGITGFLIMGAWKLIGRNKLGNIVHNRVDNISELDIAGVVEKVVKKHMPRTSSAIDKAGIHDYIDDRLNKLIKPKLEGIEEYLDDIVEGALERVESKLENTLQKKRVERKKKVTCESDAETDDVAINITNIQNQLESAYRIPVSERISELMHLKEKDGECIENWAMYAVLYREAMHQLRAGTLKINVSGQQITLQGQRAAADKIDAWVKSERVRRLNKININYDNLYHEAMVGFLYKEAVDLLRQGFFSVLGANQVADAIDEWVKDEFLKRMGLNL